MRRNRRMLVGAGVLAAAACSVYDPSLLVGGGGSPGSGNVGGSGGMGGAAGASGSGGVPLGGVSGSGTAGRAAGGTGVAGASAPQGGVSGTAGTAGTENPGGQGSDAGEAGQGNAGEGTGGDAGTGGDGAAGAGGTSGLGGTAGTGGSGGKAGSSAAGGAGAGGTAGAGGGTVASGCAELSVPLDDSADRAHFVISLTTPLDFSDAVITLRVYAAAASGGSIFSYVQDSAGFRFLGNSSRPAFTAGWQTLTWDVGAQDPGSSTIDKASIKRIGIEVNALPSSAWASPTVLFVDSITVATPTQAFTFDATGTVMPTAATSDPSTTVLWHNSGTSDTTATGVTLSWVATCP